MTRLGTVCAFATLAGAGVAVAGSAADSVTIAATPPIVSSQGPTTALAGVVSSREAGEPVTVESMSCRARNFEVFARLRTTDGGTWSTVGYVDGRTLFRARWRDTTSPKLVVPVRPRIVLGQISRRLFRVILQLGVHANGKRLALQRFDADERAWKTVKTFVFTSPSTGWPQMTLSATVPKGAQLRLALPRAQARPCYLAGYSNLLGT